MRPSAGASLLPVTLRAARLRARLRCAFGTTRQAVQRGVEQCRLIKLEDVTG
jgi:hypothetical protein